MKLVCASFGLEMELLENYVTVLVVENAGYLTEIVSSLKKQSDGEEGIFVLVENDKIEKIDKKLALVIDPFSISVNERKIINKLYTKLGEIAPDYFEDKAKLTEDAIVLLDTDLYDEIRTGNLWDKTLQVYVTLGLDHPFNAVRVREILKWGESEQYRSLMHNLNANASADRCPNCGKPVEKEWKFCRYCGCKL